jgi:hypothetical protein
MDTLTTDPQLRSGLLIGGLLAAVWTVAALAQPTSTYHLAPILIAGAVPVLGPRQEAPASRLLLAGVAGGLIAATASVALAALDLLRGPTLLPYGGAFAEALTFTVAGMVVGTVVGWLLPRQ